MQIYAHNTHTSKIPFYILDFTPNPPLCRIYNHEWLKIRRNGLSGDDYAFGLPSSTFSPNL